MFHPHAREIQFRAKIVKLRPIAKNTIEVELAMPDGFLFRAGQYIWVELHKLAYPDARGSRRAFSIVSNEENPKRIFIVFRTTSSGYKRTLSNLKRGNVVSVIGPFGSSFALDAPHKQVVCISGGIGIAPFSSLLHSTNALRNVSRTILFTYYRSSNDAPYRSEMYALTATNPTLFVHTFFRRPKKSDFEAVAKSVSTIWLISGPALFVNAVSLLLRRLGVQESKIRYEECYPAIHKKDILPQLLRSSLKPIRLFHRITNEASNHIILTDTNGKIMYANRAAEQMTGYTFAEMRNQTPRLWGGLMSGTFYKKLWKTIKKEKVFAGPILNRRKNGVTYTAITRITPLTDGSRHVIGFMATEEDISAMVAAKQAETDFVSLASHQLRTPLTSINWNTEILLSEDTGTVTNEQRTFLTEIALSTRRMVALVNTLLDMSRLELGTLIVEPEPLRLDKIANSVINEQMGEIKRRGLRLSKSFAKDVPTIPADPNLIRIVFQNLLSNAIKYSLNNGKIGLDISIDARKKLLLVRVSDAGIGIPEAQKEKIFTKFYRADNVNTVEGTGLGLYIVKSILEHVGGKIWFKSEQHKGTTFFVTLPLRGMKRQTGTRELA